MRQRVPVSVEAISLHAPALMERFRQVRARSLVLAKPLATEDMVVQTMPDVSPPKWHLAHCTWFFETFVLSQYQPGYRLYDPAWGALFNSYYQSAGTPFFRPKRGLLSRPTTAEILRYRAYVDAQALDLLRACGAPTWLQIAPLFDLGLHHEQQHQELFLTDIKHILSVNPLYPAYLPGEPARTGQTVRVEQGGQEFAGGLVEIGHAGDGFAFDNEMPRHKCYLPPFRADTRLITNGEFLEFMADGGYQDPLLWLAEGWDKVLNQGWTAPLYWSETEAGWRQFTLHGLRPVEPLEPVCHVSYFEADAYARWAGKRLLTEAEWESAVTGLPEQQGIFLESGHYHPQPASPGPGLQQIFGDLWEWTSSPYTPYPGFRSPAGALGEYNGKFMCNQMVLRGGSCVTPVGHVRASYRNFFPPDARWQFSGIRLGEDL